ncbi:MAG: lipoprotein N-acyltransferase Lnb domain-containing protein [Bdellovibrionales bacterium]
MILWLYLLLPPAFGVEATPPEISKACVRDAGDLFEPAMRITSGSFKGECLDVSSVRPVKILFENRENITVSGFYDQGKFWKAEIPLNAVAKVLFQIVPFESGVPLIQAAHTQLRFLLKPGREAALHCQSCPENSRSGDFIISSTFTAPAGKEYSAVKSLGGSYGIVTRILSSYARGKEEIQKDKSIVRQFKLKISEKEMNDLLLLGIRRSSLDAYSQIYDLRLNNCTTIAFGLLDSMRPRTDGVAPVVGSWWNIRDEFIEPSLKALRERGLIDDKSEVAPMNDEMKY